MNCLNIVDLICLAKVLKICHEVVSQVLQSKVFFMKNRVLCHLFLPYSIQNTWKNGNMKK